jgi:hypothetical protein
MYDLQLKKGGKIIAKIWDPRIKKSVEREIDYDDLNFHIYDTICVERGFTLKDALFLFSRDVELFSVLASCPFLDDLIKEGCAPTKNSKLRDEGLSALVVRWIACNDSEYLGIYPTLFGVGLDKEYSLSFSSLNEISMLPLVLEENFVIHQADTEKELFSSVKPFTLLEFSKAIFDEFMNWPPDMREMIQDELSQDYPIDSEEELKEKVKRIVNERKSEQCKVCKAEINTSAFGKPDNICTTCFSKLKEN